MNIHFVFMTKSKENVVRLEDITDIINKKFDYENNIINFNEKEILCNIEASEFEKSVSVILDIEGYTEKEAKLLDECKQKIKKGEHRKNYYLTVAYDEPSKYMSEKIFPYISKYERQLRYLIYLTFINTLGNEWVVKTIKNNNGIKLDSYNPDDILEKFTLDEYDSFLFDDIYYYNPIETLESITEAINKEDFNSKNWKIILNSKKPYSLWDKYFKKNGLDYVKDYHNRIKRFRNKVMHNKNVNYYDFIEMRSILKKTNKQLKGTIDDIKEYKYESVDINDILASLGSVMAKFQESSKRLYNALKPFYSNFATTTKTITDLAMNKMETFRSPINEILEEVNKKNENLNIAMGIAKVYPQLESYNTNKYSLSKYKNGRFNILSEDNTNVVIKAKIINKLI